MNMDVRTLQNYKLLAEMIPELLLKILWIKELERIYGVFKGNHINENTNNSVSQTDIAIQMGISVDTLQNYKLLTEMIPELEELLNIGIITKTTALK